VTVVGGTRLRDCYTVGEAQCTPYTAYYTGHRRCQARLVDPDVVPLIPNLISQWPTRTRPDFPSLYPGHKLHLYFSFDRRAAYHHSLLCLCNGSGPSDSGFR
jgi:hypothetical protein